MADFLARMNVHSRARCEAARAALPEAELRAMVASLPPPRPAPTGGVIAEVKLRSPALGRLATQGASVREQALRYGGAAAISVLTEPSAFDGDLSHLDEASAAGAPLMRKDFIVDRYQLLEARAHGASGALLIARSVDDAGLCELLDECERLSLFALIEAFDGRDLERASRAQEGRRGVLVGVNTRDLTTLEVDPGRLERLAPSLPRGVPAVAESGIATEADAAAAARLGYRLALVGTALMRSSDPASLLAALGRALAGAAP